MITQYSYGENVCASTKNNVIERFKKSCAEEIRADLAPNRTELVNVFENLDYNINIGCGIRANNAFLGKAIYVVGRRKIDRRSSVGCTHYETVFHADTMEEVITLLHEQNYTVYAIDNIDSYNPQNIWDVELPVKTAFIFGNEGDGLSQETVDMCDGMLYIQQYGSVRSLNVAQAAACAMYEYTRQLHK